MILFVSLLFYVLHKYFICAHFINSIYIVVRTVKIVLRLFQYHHFRRKGILYFVERNVWNDSVIHDLEKKGKQFLLEKQIGKVWRIFFPLSFFFFFFYTRFCFREKLKVLGLFEGLFYEKCIQILIDFVRGIYSGE